MNLDLTTERGALNYAERARSSMSDEWRKHGRFERNGHAYGAELFATHAVDTSGTPGQWKPGEKMVTALAMGTGVLMTRLLEQPWAALASVGLGIGQGVAYHCWLLRKARNGRRGATEAVRAEAVGDGRDG